MRNIEEERLSDPCAPLLQPLGMTGGTEAARLARKRQQMLCPAPRAADPREPASGVAAVKILLDDILDDRTEIAISLLETLLVFRDEALEMMEQHPIEDGPLRMPRTIDSRHIGNEESRNAPGNPRGEIGGTRDPTTNGYTRIGENPPKNKKGRSARKGSPPFYCRKIWGREWPDSGDTHEIPENSDRVTESAVSPFAISTGRGRRRTRRCAAGRSWAGLR